MFPARIYFISWICVLHVTGTAGITEKFKWPLSADYPGAEVKEGSPRSVTGSDLKRCTPHTELDYDSVLFTGTDDSYIDYYISKEVKSKKLAFSMMLHLFSPYTGVLLHYYNYMMETDMAEVMLWLNGSNLLIDVVDRAGYKYPSIVLPSLNLIGTSDFIQFAFSYDDNGDVFVATADTSYLAAVLSPWSDRKFGVPAQVRVGRPIPGKVLATPEASVNFRGRMTCLQMYTDVFESTHFDSALHNCLTDQWDHPPTPPPSVQLSPCLSERTRYVIIVEDSVPNTSEVYLDAMTTGSKLRCAEKCSRLDKCLSFAIESDANLCRMFNSSIIASNLQATLNSKYYTKQGSGNCMGC